MLTVVDTYSIMGTRDESGRTSETIDIIKEYSPHTELKWSQNESICKVFAYFLCDVVRLGMEPCMESVQIFILAERLKI